MHQLMVFCRAGFENECGREITDAAAWRGIFGFFKPGNEPGTIRFTLSGQDKPADLMEKLALGQLVFARDWFEILAEFELPASDRVGAVLTILQDLSVSLSSCQRVEVRIPEANTDRDLGNFARKWVAPLSRALRNAGVLSQGEPGDDNDRLEIFLANFTTAVAGVSRAGNRSLFAGGIPRLKLSRLSPSRSALKLDEAWKVFVAPERVPELLGGGKKAVDLGAAPGGWTSQLVRHGMLVTAIDNGPMNAELMATGHVEHIEADGFRWRPRRAVDWMVCDIVDQPRKTALMVAEWFTEKLCRYSIFNLKLPMKKRYDEWLACRSLIEERMAMAGIRYRLVARHLYHDREEITCFIERLD
jgi:23S rRNA (cytidine2498-2'-O)-methyltransferase